MLARFFGSEDQDALPEQERRAEPSTLVWNYERALERVDGDEVLLSELISIFLEECPKHPTAPRTVWPARRRPAAPARRAAAESMLPATDRPRSSTARPGSASTSTAPCTAGPPAPRRRARPACRASAGAAQPDGGMLRRRGACCILRPSGRAPFRCDSAGRAMRGRGRSACLDSGRGQAPTGRAHDAVGDPVTLGERPARTRSREMRVGVPREVKNREYRVALTPAGVTELVARRARGARRAGAPARAPRSRTRSTSPRARGSSPPPTTCGPTPTWCSRSRSRSPRSTTGCGEGQTLFTYLHLAAVQGVHRRADRRGHDGDRLRDGADGRRRAAAARPDVRGRRPAGAAGRRAQPGAGPRRPRRAAGRRLRASTPPRSSSSAPGSRA